MNFTVKRTVEEAQIDEAPQSSKRALMEQPDMNLALNPGKIPHQDSIILGNERAEMSKYLQMNTLNRVDMIGRQMKNLQDMMSDVLTEAKFNNELNNAACNFVKKPGQIYHLYEKFCGQKYFSLLSPEEWETPPHKYIGSWKLECDYSWTDPRSEIERYEGLKFLKEFGLFNLPHNSTNHAIEFNTL